MPTLSCKQSLLKGYKQICPLLCRVAPSSKAVHDTIVLEKIVQKKKERLYITSKIYVATGEKNREVFPNNIHTSFLHYLGFWEIFQICHSVGDYD